MPEETRIVEPVGLSQDDYDYIAESIETGNTAALEGYLADEVNFVLAATECCGPLTPVEVIAELDYVSGAIGPWAYPTPEATIDTYRSRFYVDYFPAGVFVMQSADADPYVVAITVTGDQITGIFIANGATLLAP